MILQHEYRCPYLTNAYSLNILVFSNAIFNIYILGEKNLKAQQYKKARN